MSNEPLLPAMGRSTQVARWSALIALLALIALQLIAIGVLRAPSEIPTLPLLLIGVGPLLLPLRGVLHGRPYTHAWAALLILFFFAYGITEVAVQPLIGGAITLLSTTFFLAALIYARRRTQELRIAAESANSNDASAGEETLPSSPGTERSEVLRGRT